MRHFTVLICSLTVHFAAVAQQPPDFGYQWSTITHPGNRPPTASEAPDLFPAGNPPGFVAPGSVQHVYRVARTEVTSEKWLEFVTAYAPHHAGSLFDVRFTSLWITPTTTGGFRITPGREQWPALVSWRMAARYCNWLTNGKSAEPWAFESGAYDASTFVTSPTGLDILDQASRSQSAAFWIPSQAEWMKAAYYDPSRYGQGVEGYWPYPYGLEVAPIPGLPSAGGQTNRGIDELVTPLSLQVGQYPAMSAPWGLLDTSGNAEEWTESLAFTNSSLSRVLRPSRAGFVGETLDRIDVNSSRHHDSIAGFRLASAVPSPPSAALAGVIAWFARRRRRCS